MKLAAMICQLDRFLENWQIVQCNLQIGQANLLIANLPDWQMARNIDMQSVLTVVLMYVKIAACHAMGNKYSFFCKNHPEPNEY